MQEKRKPGRPKLMKESALVQVTVTQEQKNWLDNQPVTVAATIRKLIAQAMGIQQKRGKATS